MAKPLSEVVETDLQQLIDEGTMESKHIEFKQTLDLQGNDQQKKFLSTIASFANALGGDVIYGMRAENGKAVQITPMSDFDPDGMTLRLRDIIRRHIDPKVFGLEMRGIPLNGGHVFIIRIPKTHVGAHMVTLNEDRRFYTRDLSGKRPMEVGEVKAAFTMGELIAKQVKEWRLDRLSNILADETPVKLMGTSRIVLHIIPVQAFDPIFKVDPKSVLGGGCPNLHPMNAHGWTPGYDFDGAFSYSSTGTRGEGDGYSYVFRNGAFESVDSGMLSSTYNGQRTPIPSKKYEQEIIEILDHGLAVLSHIGCEAPLFVSLSLLNVRGQCMALSPMSFGRGTRPIARDHLHLPEVFLDSIDVEPADVLRDSFNQIWNACGIGRSLNYNENGTWNPNATY